MEADGWHGRTGHADRLVFADSAFGGSCGGRVSGDHVLMLIIFEQLTESLVEGHANGALRYGARALGLGIEFGIAGGGLSYSGVGELFQEDSGITPEEQTGAAVAIVYGREVVGFVFVEADIRLYCRSGYVVA